MSIATANAFALRHMQTLEISGVIVRISCFTFVSWLGPESPFMLVWICNTADAVLLTWCARLRRDFAYTLLNGFWILVGALGIARASGWLQTA